MSSIQPICLITGASTGIGAALARRFAAAGYPLVLVARRPAELGAVADKIARDGHTRPHIICADLATGEGISHLAEELRAGNMEPAILVNNAGFGLLGPASQRDSVAQLAMIDLNMRALTDLTLRYLDSIVRHEGGILNVASIAGFLPGPGMAVYHATKAYVVSFTHALRAEIKSGNVKVCALCPGPVQTEFFGRAGIPESYFPGFMARSLERVAREGYRGFMRGQATVIPGAVNRIFAYLPRLLPRALVLAAMERRWNRATGPSGAAELT